MESVWRRRRLRLSVWVLQPSRVFLRREEGLPSRLLLRSTPSSSTSGSISLCFVRRSRALTSVPPLLCRTGTLTTGKPSVTDTDYRSSRILSSIFSSDDSKGSFDERRFLLTALRDLESQSSHPLATALRAFADDQLHLFPPATVDFSTTTGACEEITGRGLKAVVTSSFSSSPAVRFEVCIGNEALLTSVGVVLPSTKLIQKWQEGAKSVVLLAVKRLSPGVSVDEKGSYEVCAGFAVADPPRPEAEETIRDLQKAGKEVWMLSGSSRPLACLEGCSTLTPFRPSLTQAETTKSQPKRSPVRVRELLARADIV